MSRYLSLLCVLFLAMTLLPAPMARGQEAAPIPLLDRAATLQAAQEVTPAKYPDADDVLVDDLIRVRYEADGTAVTTDETWTKVLTEKGRRDNQKLSLHFHQVYSAAAVDLLEVIKPDGTAVPIDVAKLSRVMTERGQMGSNIYDPNSKVLEVGIPGLAVGDVVHYRSVQRIVKPRVPKTWSDYNTFESTSPIRHLTYEVSAPKELPLKSLALKDAVPGTVTPSQSEEGGRLLYRWDVRDVPQMHEEPSMPPTYTCVQRLLVSTIGDWSEISRWYWSISQPHLQPTDGMKQTVADLAKGLDDRQKKIEAVFQYVSQKVRYMGLTLEKDAPGYEPHDVCVTFDNKYGVCRDKAALLVAMLRLAEVEAYPVLIHSGPKKDAEAPQPYFNHAIVAARGAEGAWLLMDPTDENTRELLPAYLSNLSYLVATPEGDSLRTSPIAPATENLMRIDTAGKLNAAGDLSAQSTLRFDGINDNAYRDYFSKMQPEERRAIFEGLARRVVAGARLTEYDLQPADLMDTTAPLTVRLRFEARNVPITDGEVVLLPLPRVGTRIGIVNFLLGATGLDQRKYPLVTRIACGVQETLTLETEGLGAAIALPKYETVETDAVRVSVSLAREGNTLKRTEQFLLKEVEFTPAQYATLKDALKAMEFNERQKALFAVSRTEGDVRILADTTACDLADAHTWTETRTVKMQVLTYAGKKKRSELKMNYNPAWEELTLESATVTAPDGTVKAVQPQEQNLMDAAWVGSAPRYPAGKTLVASLPGVEIGSVIEYRIRRVCKDRPFFALRESFRGSDPVDARTLRIQAPEKLALRVKPLFADALRMQERTADGVTRREWTAPAQAAVKPEMLLPPSWAFTPTVCVSAGDWKAYGESVGRALAAAADTADEAGRRARQLTADLRDRAARIVVIRDFVARGIRAAGPGLSDLPLSALTPADRTLADGYGNSADRAVLLFAMLKAAGFRPSFVLASGAPAVENVEHPMAACPHAGDFDAVLVRVRLDDKDYYLNDTNEYAALGSTAYDGCYGLDLRAGALVTLHALPGMVDRSSVQYHVAIEPIGDAVIRKTTFFYGMAYAEARKKFSEILPEERRRYFQEAVASIAQAATPEGALVTLFGSYPGVEEFTVRVPRYAVRDGQCLYFTLPATLQDLFALRSETRDHPLYWPGPRRVAIGTTLALPAEFADLVLKPAATDWRAPQGAGSVHLRLNATTRQADGLPGLQYYIEQSADLAPALIPAQEYGEVLRLQQLLSHPKTRTLLLRNR